MRRATSLLTAAALILVGCGSDADQAGSDSVTPASSSVAPSTEAAPEADASAQLACRHFRNVMGDLEILSGAELREKVQEVHDTARVSEEPGVAPAAREMLAAATADDGDRFLTAVGDMHEACLGAGL
jgi:hypothetical protein